MLCVADVCAARRRRRDVVADLFLLLLLDFLSALVLWWHARLGLVELFVKLLILLTVDNFLRESAESFLKNISRFLPLERIGVFSVVPVDLEHLVTTRGQLARGPTASHRCRLLVSNNLLRLRLIQSYNLIPLFHACWDVLIWA